jgi:hypothetical protein
MLKHNKVVIISAAGLLLTALPALAKTPQKAKPKLVPVQTALIENTGSTNTKGYQLDVSSDGSAAISTGVISEAAATGQMVVHYKVGTIKDASKFFQDLNTAMPLTGLPVRHGMRSASFGTATFITYKGQRSPDLTFASDPRTVALKADIDSITKALHVENAPRHPLVLPVKTPNDNIKN